MQKVQWSGGTEHWAQKEDVKLFLWEKKASTQVPYAGTLLFIHGSSMASQPSFDLHVPDMPGSSAMEWFNQRGFDTWCMDNEGYGRSDKHRNINCDISNGVDDLAVGSDYIRKVSGKEKLLVYGISSGALKAALFAQRYPERVARLALDAFVWTGKGSPTLENRAKGLADYLANPRRPISREFIHSIFNRDHPDTTEKRAIEAYADAILSLDDSVPTGTYVDMCSKLPLVDPLKITAPTLIMRGQYDGIASTEDLLQFFEKLPNMDKQFSVMSGISHASFLQKNYLRVYHILHSFLSMPNASYEG